MPDPKMLDHALQLAAIGWSVFPCRPGLKTPATKNGFKDATTDPEKIRAWWSRNPLANVGVATGPASGFWALDVDVTNGCEGQKTLDDLERAHGEVPITPWQTTGRGGRHYLFTWTEGVRNRGKFAPGLDVRGEGGYIIVAPSSLTAGGRYAWQVEPDVPTSPAPDWLLEMIVSHARPVSNGDGAPRSHVAPERAGRGTPWGEAAIRNLCAELAACPPGSQSDMLIRHATRGGSIAGGGSIDEGFVLDSLVAAGMAMVNGDPRDPWTQRVVEDVVRRGMAHGARDPTPAPEPRSPASRGKPQLRVVTQEAFDPETGEIIEPAPHHVATPRSWMAAHTWIWKDADELILKSTALWNFKQMVEFHPSLAGMFYYDDWRDQIIVTKGLPGDDRADYPRTLSDHDETALAAWLNHEGLSPAINTVASIIREVAFRNPKNPINDWLRSLEWDGVERVETWLPVYAGAADNPYNRTVGRKFMISAIARAMQPGCKCDTMPVLEGKQGLKKSTLIRTLCGAEYFSDQIGDINNKDAQGMIQGYWIIEVPEMDKFGKKESETVKDFLARQEDRYRPPYGRNYITRSRRCVFVGTINPIVGAGYVKDPTGARRFWPVECTKIDLNAMRLNREQLWAEAFQMWAGGQTWWIDEDEAHIVQGEQDARIEDDVWEPKVEEWLDSKSTVFTVSEALKDAVGMSLDRQDQRAKNRMAGIFTRLKCVRDRAMIDGKQQRCYRRSE